MPLLYLLLVLCLWETRRGIRVGSREDAALKSEVNPVIIIVSVVALLAILGGVGYAVFGPKKLSGADDAAMRAKYMPGSAVGTPIKNEASKMATSKAPPPGVRQPGRPGQGQGQGQGYGGMQRPGGQGGYPGMQQRPGGQ